MEIQLIVDKLNEDPFRKGLRLVEFDEKSPLELLQTLQEVFEAIDPQQRADVRQEAEDARVARTVAFLQMLKFAGVDPQALAAGIASGDKAAVYPVLYWCLPRLPQLQKRAYLARYLMPADIPTEYLQDLALAQLQETYRQLQGDFKVAHKTVDRLRGSDARPNALRTEIGQLEDERRALQEKVAKAKRAGGDEPGFEQMLEATSRLRRSQEEAARLAERLQEQRAIAAQVEARAAEAQRRLQQLRHSAGSSSAEAVLRQLQQEVDRMTQVANQALPREAGDLRRRLRRLQRERAEPPRSREEAEELRAVAAALRKDNEARRQRAEDVLAARGDGNLSMFRQQAGVAARKLMDREEEREKLEAERRRLLQDLEDAGEDANAASGAGSSGQGGGAAVMSREEFREFSARLRDTTAAYRRAKAELAVVQSEAVVLHRTEQLLKSRDHDLEGFLRRLEAEKGVTGYRDAHAKLVAHSEQTAQVDAQKGATLADISQLVNGIAAELRAKQERLRPLIEELRGLRQEANDIEAEYQRRRGAYDKVAVGLDVDRQQLETECDGLQEACLREEGRFHTLQCLCSIAETQVARAEQEERWERGDGRLLPDFRCYKDLYEHKLRQQESMSKQLRRAQKSIRERESGSAEQRKHFAVLHQTLAVKLASKQRVLRERQGDAGAHDEAYLKAVTYGGPSSNVMTVSQHQ